MLINVFGLKIESDDIVKIEDVQFRGNIDCRVTLKSGKFFQFEKRDSNEMRSKIDRLIKESK